MLCYERIVCAVLQINFQMNIGSFKVIQVDSSPNAMFCFWNLSPPNLCPLVSIFLARLYELFESLFGTSTFIKKKNPRIDF